eukprot:TRINITY_DN14530_c0_g1_i1.p1 TRINITY_DN14530_c0_g1~~TRINITY_DN14530_c0_g1_i1.p1  ORF type:complete len:323 (-),score=22.10 TRINITY_DN14530_c0_g1_i1:150-1118(-)
MWGLFQLFIVLFYSNSVFCIDVNETCNDKFVYHDNAVLPNLYQFITDKSVYSEVFGGTEYTRKDKQLIAVYWVNGTKPHQKFIVCIPEKVGRVKTKMMISRVTDPNYDGIENRREMYFTRITDLQKDVFDEIMQNPDILRFAFTRDPYTRVISMYNMFFGRREKDKSVKLDTGFKWNQNVTFGQFVERLRNFKKEVPKKEKNRHFVPQTASCFIPQGMRYNYILQQQDQDQWWPCFIRKTNIYEEMMHGWAEEDKCFLSTERDPCNGPQLENGTMINDGGRGWRNSNSTRLLDTYYANKTLLNLVTQTFLEDIINFGFEIRY